MYLYLFWNLEKNIGILLNIDENVHIEITRFSTRKYYIIIINVLLTIYEFKNQLHKMYTVAECRNIRITIIYKIQFN